VLGRRIHHPLTPYAFLAPTVAILGLFLLYPMARVIHLSFTRYTAFRPPEWNGAANWQALLTDERFWTCLANSAIYLVVTPVLIVLSLAAALLVDARIRGASLLRILLFVPVITPTIVGAVAWRLLFSEDDGLINQAIASVGLPPVRWLSSYPWTLITAMTVTIWKGFGFYMVIFLAALLGVPRELREAAAIDGAGRVTSFRHVTLPAIWPSVVLVLIISSISALKVFDELYVAVKGAPITHQTVVPLVYQTAFLEGDLGMASTIGLALFLIILVFSILNLRITRSRGAS